MKFFGKYVSLMILMSFGIGWSAEYDQADDRFDNHRSELIRKVQPELLQQVRLLEKGERLEKDAVNPGAIRVVINLEPDGLEIRSGEGGTASLAASVAQQQDQFMNLLNDSGRGQPLVEIVLQLSLNFAVAGYIDSEEVLVKLAQMDIVRSIEIDNLNQLFTVEGRDITGSTLAASSGHTGAGIGVCIIDSHFDLLHPELGGSTSLPNSVVKGGQNFSDPGTSIHSQNFNDCYHGTGTASIVKRYAPGASIYCNVVFPNAYDSVIADAINWCITNKSGVGGGAPIRVISMSLGGSRHYSVCNSGVMHTSSGNALANDILVFAASGNDGWTDSMGSPACSDNVISVGSVWDENGANYSPFPPANCNDFSRQVNERTCYSDTASFLDIYAPSEEVMCAQCGGGTWALGGTSSACPAAAGMTAQVLDAQSSYYGNKSGLLSLYQSTGVSVIGDTSKRRIDLEAALGLGSTPAPTANLSASPGTITQGQSTTLSWTTTDASSASISGIGNVTPVSSGSMSVSPSSTTTYTLTATGSGGTDTDSVTVTVNPPGGGTTALEDGVTVNYSVSTGNTVEYTIPIPANCTSLTVSMTGSGDADLYVKRATINWPGDQGSHNEAEFKAPYASGSSESVTFSNPAQDTWNVLIHGYSGNPAGTITADWEVSTGGGGGNALENGVAESYSVSTGSTVEYTIPVPANCTNLTVSMTGSGDADLYVKRAAINWPGDKGSHNESEFKAPYQSGSSESVTFTNPAQDTWNVLIHGYSGNPSGTITANWEVSTGGGGGTPAWHYEDFVRTTPHNYANNSTYSFEYEYPGATSVAVHFERLTTESNYDFLYIYDENGTELYKVSGSLISNGTGSAFGRTDGWVVVTGSKVTVTLQTDYSVTKWGYETDTAAAYY